MNSTIELIKNSLARGNTKEVTEGLLQLSARLKFLEPQNSYQAEEEQNEIEDFLNNTEIPQEVVEKLYGPEPLVPTLEEPIIKPVPVEIPIGNQIMVTEVVQTTIEEPVAPRIVMPPATDKWLKAPLEFEYKKWIFNNLPHTRVSPNDPVSIGISGIKKQGKTSLMEALLIIALQAGQSVLTCGGARDNELLAAFRAPFRNNVIAITGEEVTVTGAPSITYDKFDVQNPKRYFWYVMDRAFFGNETTYFNALNDVLNRMEARTGWDVDGKHPHVLWTAIPEAGDVIRARVAMGQSPDMKDAIVKFESMNRTLWHSGVSLILDFQRETSVSADIRTLNDFRFWVNQGYMKIDPKTFKFMFRPGGLRTSIITQLKPGQAIMSHISKQVALVRWSFPKFHITRGEPMLKNVGITVTVDEEKLSSIMSSLQKNSRQSKLDEADEREIYERATTIGADGKPESLRHIAEDMGLNPTTVSTHFKKYKREHKTTTKTG